MWEVEFFMPEGLPYNRIASADAYAGEETYLRKAFGINSLNFPRFFENHLGSKQNVGS